MLHYRAVARTSSARLMDIMLGIVGVVGMVYTTALTINQWVEGSAPKVPGYCDKR